MDHLPGLLLARLQSVPWKKEFVHDLPGGVGRFKAWGHGVHATVVNGVPIVVDGELTGRLPGQVVRPGVLAP